MLMTNETANWFLGAFLEIDKNDNYPNTHCCILGFVKRVKQFSTAVRTSECKASLHGY